MEQRSAIGRIIPHGARLFYLIELSSQSFRAVDNGSSSSSVLLASQNTRVYPHTSMHACMHVPLHMHGRDARIYVMRETSAAPKEITGNSHRNSPEENKRRRKRDKK